jgi:very-short-patch-repair endonuclease
VCQYPVVRADRRLAIFDFAYPALRLAIEVDGNGTHATPEQRRADNERSNQLPSWRVVRFTHEDVIRRPRVVATTVALHLRS